MKLSVAVRVSHKNYNSFLRHLQSGGYAPLECLDGTVLVNGVNVGYRNEGGCFVYPVNFARNA